MAKLKIDSEEAQLLIWLISEGFYIPLDTISKDDIYIHKISDALSLQKEAMNHLKDSTDSPQPDKLLFDTNIISVIALTLFHSSILMDQPKFWESQNKHEIRGSIDRFAKQNYHKNSQFINDFKTICNFTKSVETYLVSREDLASNYYYNKEKPDEYLIASRLNYLVPIKPREYSDIVLDFFELFFGGYKSSINQHAQMHKTFKALCCPFGEEHMLVSKDVAQALLATIRSKEINKEWAILAEKISTDDYASLIESSREEYSEDLQSVFPERNHLPTTVSKKTTIPIPGSVLDETKLEHQFVFHQALDGSSSLVELTTIDSLIEEFLDMVLFDDELSAFFKKAEYARIAADITLPSFCDVKPKDTVYLMPEGIRIGIVEKNEYDVYVQEYKELIQE